jgi:hypothetical protein
MYRSTQERAGCHHNGATVNLTARSEPDALYGPVGNQKISHFSLNDRESFLRRKLSLHGLAIDFAIALCARAANSRPFAPVEKPELYSRRISDPPHYAVKRVNLTNKMAFPQAPNCRIT